MEAYIKKGEEDTPEIILDKEKNVYTIIGRSLPEDVLTFYKPTLAWLEGFAANPSQEMNLDIKLEYFNTASSKLLLSVLMKLNELHNTGKCKVNINWHYDVEDDDMLEAGQEYAELVELPFKMLSYS